MEAAGRSCYWRACAPGAAPWDPGKSKACLPCVIWSFQLLLCRAFLIYLMQGSCPTWNYKRQDTDCSWQHHCIQARPLLKVSSLGNEAMTTLSRSLTVLGKERIITCWESLAIGLDHVNLNGEYLPWHGLKDGTSPHCQPAVDAQEQLLTHQPSFQAQGTEWPACLLLLVAQQAPEEGKLLSPRMGAPEFCRTGLRVGHSGRLG